MATATATASTDPKKKTAAPEDGAEEPKKGGKKKLVIVAVLLVAVLGAGYFFFLKPSGPAKPQPGAVVALDPITLNLADGHYLKLGLALQATKAAKEAPDGSHALDLAIDLFSGRKVAELGSATAREKLKKQLGEEVDKAYEGDVMGVYFTQFVTQ
ncbi:MAG: flagellar basal body-associated FliL family protein [Motilibacteraceae bacterium]